MLRTLFGEPKRTDQGDLLKIKQSIREFISRLDKMERSRKPTLSTEKLYRFRLWGRGFIDAVDELEQSLFCSLRFSERVGATYIEEMNPQELDDYHRFVYFYKNGFIRLFSILDKLGYFLNDLFELQTEKVKERFSYFTVLRQMHDQHIHPELQRQLYELKLAYKEPMGRLRKQRNIEIHYLNVDMLDDWTKGGSKPEAKLKVEDVRQQAAELQVGYEMACRSLIAAFAYINKLMRRT
jgi:hypothetical protein